MATDESCCPKDSHGELVAPEVPVQGEEKRTAGGVDYYEVGKGSKLVLLCTDIYGWRSGRHRIICEQLANEGYHVYMPDYFHGRPQLPAGPKELTRLSEDFDSGNVLKTELVGDLIPLMKKNGDGPVAAVGFCFGGWVTGKLAALGEIKVGISCHPAFKPEVIIGGTGDAIAKATPPECQLLWMPAGNDSKDFYPGGTYMKIYGERAKSVPFEDMAHGWMTRGDRADPAIKQAQDSAMKQILDFLSKL